MYQLRKDSLEFLHNNTKTKIDLVHDITSRLCIRQISKISLSPQPPIQPLIFANKPITPSFCFQPIQLTPQFLVGNCKTLDLVMKIQFMSWYSYTCNRQRT